MKRLKLVLLVALSFAVAGCMAAKQETAATTASNEWRLKSLEESFLNFREAQRMQADQNSAQTELIFEKLETLEAQLAAMKGDAPVTGNAPGGMADEPEDEGWVTDLKPDDENWVDGQRPVEQPVAESGEEKPWAEVPGPPETIPEPTVVQRTPAAPAKQAAVRPKPTVSGAQAMYNQGMAKYRANDYVGARGAFDEFLKKYPRNKLVANALYWKGETFYGQKDYPQAILAFKEVTSRFPKHSKAADALLKIGMSYDRVGDPDNAIFYLRALVEDFPGSASAGRARTELARLGG